MITPQYCQTMARYNIWQNTQMRAAMERLTEAELTRDRGAFFGSIMGTANHLLWGDLIWMARFDGAAPPDPKHAEATGTALCKTLAQWSTERHRADQRIADWAARLQQARLDETLTFHSGMLKRDLEKPMALCVTHFFNHQTHHRGQIHAMLGAAGETEPVSDLAFMPSEEP